MKEFSKLGWVSQVIAHLPPLLDAMAAHPVATTALMMFIYLITRKQP